MMIKTPDQRVRIFISSTIKELAEERLAAREAISNLHLTPVFFEAGARPHPPRDLYSAYLDQSHIFLGIYWKSYGWVSPGMSISGLEDEYRICDNRKPRLIYVKQSDERQPRLNDLIADIQNSNLVCYQSFNTAEELKLLIEKDLSMLISESFENALFAKEQITAPSSVLTQPKRRVILPIIREKIIGRDEDIAKVSELLRRPEVSILTLMGTGGTGKTTLAIHVAHQVKDDFADGAVFVPLAPVTDSQLVASTIADLIGFQDSGTQSIHVALTEYLADKNMLLVLDNFEQITDAAHLVSDIAQGCKDVKILVTSRTSLHLRNERIYNLAALGLPSFYDLTPEDLEKAPSSMLFLERALAVNPDLPLHKENIKAIVEICQKLDGLPLAIELAAARTRFFQPAVLISRMHNALDLVSKGHKDLPERQQTLRGTIEWSYNLLQPETQKSFRQLGIFRGSWTIEAADAVLNAPGEFVDIEEMTELLLDVSLIKPMLQSQIGNLRFNMLQTVQEYASELLNQSPEGGETTMRYANYYHEMLSQTEGLLYRITAEPWLDWIDLEMQNIRASFHAFMKLGDLEKAWDIYYFLFPYRAIRGGYSEAMTWLEESGIRGERNQTSTSIREKSRGRAIMAAAFDCMTLFRLEQGFELGAMAENILRQAALENYLAFNQVMLGCYGTFTDFPGSTARLEEGIQLGIKHNQHEAVCFGYCWSFKYYLSQGRPDIVEENFRKCEEIATANDLVFILLTLKYIRYMLLSDSGPTDYPAFAQMMMSGLAMIPEKGYKGSKAPLQGAYGYAMLKIGNIELAGKSIFMAMETAIECGEVAKQMDRCIEGALYFVNIKEPRKAATLLGAAINSSTQSGFPMIGTVLSQCEEAREHLLADITESDFNLWFEQGKKLSCGRALSQALN